MRPLALLKAIATALTAWLTFAAWAGGRHGPGYAVQGNILTGEDVAAAMERRFLETEGQPLAERLLQALVAGDAAGGDSRGRQSAARRPLRTQPRRSYEFESSG